MKYLICFLLMMNIGLYATEETVPPKEAWVVFATADYFDLLEVTIASVHEFSSRPIIAFGINADLPFSEQKYPRLIKKRLDTYTAHGYIYYQKPRIIFESELDFGVYIEADDILIKGCDELFKYAHLERAYPLCPIHPNDVRDQQSLMQVLDIKQPSMHYVHGHVIFSKQCMPFVREWYATCMRYPHLAPNFDETVLNVLLWKHDITENVPTYDPYYLHAHQYITLNRNETAASPFRMFHGCKNPKEAWEIFSALKSHALQFSTQ